jgi:DNA repair protein RecO
LAYIVDLADAFVPEREPNVKLYRLVRATVSSLTRGAEPETTACYFEAWLLRLGGYYPRRRSCSACGNRLAEVGARYVVEEYRLLCQRCSERGVPLSVETLAYLQRIWREPPGSFERPRNRQVLSELEVLHQTLIRSELDKELGSHQVLQDLIRRER